jgi:uncharacterized protein
VTHVRPSGENLARRTESTVVALFLAITFLWAWSLWGYWVFAMPSGGLQVSPAFILCALVGGLAPSLAALAVTRYTGPGQISLQLLGPLGRWRMNRASLAVALLLVPSLTVVSVGLQAAFVGPVEWPDPSLLMMALIWPLLAALGEELGWRGVLLPRLEGQFGLVGAAIVVGLVWGLWHLPADYIALKGYGGWFWLTFLLNGPVVLTAHSIIIAWLWRRTGGSLFAAVLYHVSITASAIVAPTVGLEGLPGVLAAAVGAGVVWLAAAALLLLRTSWRV